MAEWLKYDAGAVSSIIGLVFLVAARVLDAAGHHARAFKLRSLAFRFNWGRAASSVSSSIAASIDRNRTGVERVQEPVQTVLNSASDSLKPLAHTAKFFDDPRELFEGVMIVLASPKSSCKGVILVKYSYYFLLLERFFDIASLQKDYWLVIEPSWNGYCDESILCFLRYPEPVFVLTPEPHDRRFIESLDSNLIIVPTGPNAFVDHRMFAPDPAATPRYDLAMVAGWSRFKRHEHVFAALAALRDNGRIVNMVLMGYAGDRSLDSIRQLADDYGVSDQLEFHDTLPPEQVVHRLQRSRCSILWSRFEGSPRVVPESLFCDVPCIVREGLNYGEPYHFVNNKTGLFANEKTLPEAIASILDSPKGQFSPRAYMLECMTYEHSALLIERVIADFSYQRGHGQGPAIARKVNFLHGMRYANADDVQRFASDYARLAGYLLSRNV